MCLTMSRPNLLIICPDQLRADYLSSYGHPFIATDNLSRLAGQGVQLNACYCAAPLCGPSRISFATSTYLSNHQHRNYGSTVSPDVPNLVTTAKAAGYRTGMFGKNHLFTYDRLPEVWDELDEICLGNYDGHPAYKHSFTAFEMEPDHPYNITGRLTDETIDFMERHREQPFVAWVNYQDPHPAFTCPAPYSTMFAPDQIELPESWSSEPVADKPRKVRNWWHNSDMDKCTETDMKRAIAMYCGQIRYVDDSVGRMLECLERTGLADNTVVLFFADHGELLGDFGVTHKLPVFYECLCRIPVLLRDPSGRWQGVQVDGLVEEVDLAPTVLEMMGLEAPPSMVGRSLVEMLEAGRTDTFKETALVEAGVGAPTPEGPVPGAGHRAPFAPNSFGAGAMVREGTWKLSIFADDRCELYNLADDPHEMTNLYGRDEVAEVQNRLTLKLAQRVMSTHHRRGDLPDRWPGPGPDPRYEPLD